MIRIVPPLWFFLFLLLGLASHFFFPETRVFDLDIPYSWVFGAVLIIGGWAMTLNASRLFAIEKTEILPASETNRTLIVYGPYRFSRNPMYLGMIITLLGVAIGLGTLPPFIAVIAHFAILNFIFIPFEEEKMARQFGEQYADYKKSVRRWL